MALDYAALKSADAALGIADPAAAAAALNAQTVTVAADIPSADARAVLLLSGEWFKIKQLAKMALTGTATDQAIAAADICVDTLTLTTTLQTSSDAVWAAMQPMIGGLQAAGVISADSVAAWAAMRERTRRAFPSDVTGDDIIAARTQF